MQAIVDCKHTIIASGLNAIIKIIIIIIDNIITYSYTYRYSDQITMIMEIMKLYI